MAENTKKSEKENDVLTKAKAALVLLRASSKPPAERALVRFEQKIRLVEKAVEAGGTARGATSDGLRAVLSRAEATAAVRPPTPAQTLALESLRAEIGRRENGASAGSAKTAKLLASLAADTAVLEKRAAAKSAKPAKAKGGAKPKKKR